MKRTYGHLTTPPTITNIITNANQSAAHTNISTNTTANAAAEPPSKSQHTSNADARAATYRHLNGSMPDARNRQNRQNHTRQNVNVVDAYVYADVINRAALNFDIEQMCSETLSNLHVYVCLTCGVYISGRSATTPAARHSVDCSHYLFLNLSNSRIYNLADNTPLDDILLNDIRFNSRPFFSYFDLSRIDNSLEVPTATANDGHSFIIGLKGINDLKNNSAINCCIHLLTSILPLRDFFLLRRFLNVIFPDASFPSVQDSQYSIDSFFNNKSTAPQSPFDNVDIAHLTLRYPVSWAYYNVLARIYNPKSFRAVVSPHAFIETVSKQSNRKFVLGQPVDPLAFLSFFLHKLHQELYANTSIVSEKSGSKQPAPKTSIIYQSLGGKVVISSATIPKPIADDSMESSDFSSIEKRESKTLYLSLSLPPAPLFNDAEHGAIIPQLSLFELLDKFNGRSVVQSTNNSKETFSLTVLPRYLMMHVRRFTENAFGMEKNPTLVLFPMKNLDMTPYYKPNEINGADSNIKTQSKWSNSYDLVAVISHEGSKFETGHWKSYVCTRKTGQWWECNDEVVRTDETMAQQVSLCEAYILLYERKHKM